MDALSGSFLYSFDANVMSITRHANAFAPEHRVYMSTKARDHLATVRAGIILSVNAGKSVELAIDAWQDVLAVYFAHWGE